LATSANYATANPQDNVTITWSDAVLAGTTAAAPTFVAAHYAALPTNCSDNFKAWSITPIKAFTVDVLNIENATSAPLAYDAEDDQCNDIVRGAVYNAGTSSMEYDYGTQVLYYEVVAANFTNEYDLTLTMTGLHAVQTPVIEYTYDPPAWTPATVWTDITSDNTIETTETNTNTGVSVYVRVTITNDNYEGVADRPVTLTVDAVNSVGEWDIENNTTSNPGPLCNPGTLNDGMDIAVQVLKARPTLTPVVPTPFVPGNEQN
jgi:hypothetical protein